MEAPPPEAGACDSCGETFDELYAVGTVFDFTFRPDSASADLLRPLRGPADELNPDAVGQMQAPRTLSRPNSVSDVE